MINVHLPPAKRVFNPRCSCIVQFVIAIIVDAFIECRDDIAIEIREVEALVVDVEFRC